MEKKNENMQERKVESVVTGNVEKKKRSGFAKLTDIFMPSDVGRVKNHILHDVIIPNAKKVALESFESFLYDGTSRRSSSTGTAQKVSYNLRYNDNRSSSAPTRVESRGYNYDELIFETKGEAERVLYELDELIKQYRVVRVSDLYAASGIRDYPWTANDYGWSDIRYAEPIRMRDGRYLLKMPKAMPLDK